MSQQPPIRPENERRGAGVGEKVPPLGARSMRGAFWTTLFSLSLKVVSLLGQIALAWFLVPEEMGLVALTYSVTILFEWINGGGLADLLVQRRRGFERLACQVFYLLMATSFGAAILAVAASPLAGLMFRDNRVIPLIILCGFSWPVAGAMLPYRAKMLRQLRFRGTAAITFGIGAMRVVGSVVLAAAGLGPYALVLGLYAGYVFGCIGYRLLAGPIEYRRPRLRLWPALLGPTFFLMLFGLFSRIRTHGVNLIIGVVHAAGVAGLYYWGFMLSTQTMALLNSNLREVLFPALTLLSDDRERQFAGFMSACRVALVLTTPMCLLQALSAEPLIHLVFKERWWPAAPVVTFLSFGLLTQPFNMLSYALLRARGQFRLLAILISGQVAGLALAAVMGALLGQEQAVAIGAAIADLLGGFVAGYVSLRMFDRGLRDLLAVIMPLLGLAVVSTAAGYGAQYGLRAQHEIVQLLGIVAAASVAYGVLLWVLLPERVREVMMRVRSFVQRKKKASAA